MLGEKYSTFFEYLGLLVFGYAVIKTGIKLFGNIGTFFLGFGSVNLKKYGPWAAITGCTDGIGKAYAEHLAKRGLNLVLLSRSLDKLEDLSKTLKEKYSIQTKVIAVDFTEPTTIYAEIKRQIADMDIGILVNNVGIGYKHPEYYDVYGESDKTVSDLINCNIMSVTKMTAIVLPNMVKNKRGIIINNASGSGRSPTPLLTVYSATKAYVDFFSRSLNGEYKSKGIIVQSLCPYYVSTKLSAVRSSLMAPKPYQYVASALKTIGSQPVTNGYLMHNIQGWFMESFLPESILESLMLSQLVAVRKRALAKIKRQEEQSTTPKKSE